MNSDEAWFQDEEYWEAIAPVLYSEQEEAASTEEIDDIVRLLDIEPGDAILDLCCGPGRHSIAFARRGFRVTGVDITEVYIRWARRRARKDEVDVEFVCADMREFRRPDTFAAAVNLSTSFGYFDDPDDDMKVLTNLYDSLRAGGTLVMDLLGKRILRRNEPIRNWTEVGDTLLLQERTLNEEETEVDCREILIHNGKRKEYRYSHRVYSAERLAEALADTGFRSVGICGDFKGTDYAPGADRLVAVTAK
jgi:SAM-dependent methyltransferase